MNKNIKSFDITRGRKVEFGYLSGIKNQMNSMSLDLEMYLYDLFLVPFQVEYEIKEDIQFQHYLSNLENSKLMLTFELKPLQGLGLMNIDNKFINLLLSKEKLKKDKKINIPSEIHAPINNEVIKDFSNDVLELLSEYWNVLYPTKHELKKLVSHKIKARVINPFEPCIIISIKIRFDHFISTIELCFSKLQLDPIIHRVKKQDLLISKNKNKTLIKENYFMKTVENTEFQIKSILGDLLISKKKLIECMKNKTILPIANPSGQKAAIYINDTLLLGGTIGKTKNYYSIFVEDVWEEVKIKKKKAKKEFEKIKFPSSI